MIFCKKVQFGRNDIHNGAILLIVDKNQWSNLQQLIFFCPIGNIRAQLYKKLHGREAPMVLIGRVVSIATRYVTLLI